MSLCCPLKDDDDDNDDDDDDDDDDYDYDDHDDDDDDDDILWRSVSKWKKWFFMLRVFKIFITFTIEEWDEQ